MTDGGSTENCNNTLNDPNEMEILMLRQIRSFFFTVWHHHMDSSYMYNMYFLIKPKKNKKELCRTESQMIDLLPLMWQQNEASECIHSTLVIYCMWRKLI